MSSKEWKFVLVTFIPILILTLIFFKNTNLEVFHKIIFAFVLESLIKGIYDIKYKPDNKMFQYGEPLNTILQFIVLFVTLIFFIVYVNWIWKNI